MHIVRLLMLFLCCALCCLKNAPAQGVITSGTVLSVKYTDKDSAFKPQGITIQKQFNTDSSANQYIQDLPALFAAAGYVTASVDSLQKDSTGYTVHLFVGDWYTLKKLNKGNVDEAALQAAGFYKRKWDGRALNLAEVYKLKKRLLDYYENNGYPFASLSFDSVQLQPGMFSAVLKIDKSVPYVIDSIRIIGKGKVSSNFLQQYLGIKNRSAYNGDRLRQVDKKMMELPFLKSLQPSDISMTGSGAVLNLYADPRKSSKVNFIVGFVPDPVQTGKLQLTGDVDLDLKNMLRSGESIMLKWQQLQRNSPRLNLGFNIPYMLRSSFGIEALFDMYKKDSSFLQLNAQLGLQYAFSSTRSGKFIVQFQGNNLLAGGIDTNLVKSSKRLPDIIDMSAVNTGLQFESFGTDYRLNPTKGFEWQASALIGIKKVKPNPDVLQLEDPNFDYGSLYDSISTKSYQINVTLKAAKYFPVKKNVVLKTGLQGGMYYSPQVFRNDQYRIGGFRTLRGFDEEGIFSDRYAIGTAELRYLSGMNSYLFVFSDMAYSYSSVSRLNKTFISGGLGIMLETKLGLLNVSYAAGKRSDVPFNLREASKVHIGYINYF
ncbi:MAG TPA: BamA/TamA family outer membrane protein [Ferruginibacter sp.]|nr:BamA/TamA family outer membrane protein [Ferruginibacter sp.]HRO18225.1 BamA/TamA family outer membrane protein [Ferruginibacter sp.]HRQ21536.1 BamA/TamA family outer membrane protein [Ferruginibacter sp.]